MTCPGGGWTPSDYAAWAALTLSLLITSVGLWRYRRRRGAAVATVLRPALAAIREQMRDIVASGGSTSLALLDPESKRNRQVVEDAIPLIVVNELAEACAAVLASWQRCWANAPAGGRTEMDRQIARMADPDRLQRHIDAARQTADDADGALAQLAMLERRAL